MSLVTRTWSSTWSTVISTPAVTPAPLLRLRDESRWNTCGYVSGNADYPHTLCDDCVCESTSGIMVECSGSGDDRTCDPATTLCYPSTFASGATPESGDLFCTEPSSPECQVMLWTDIDVYSIVGCAPSEIVISLSFSHPETTATDSVQTSSSSSSKTRTTTPAPVATSTPTPKRKYFTAAETAGMSIGLAVFVAFLTGALFQFFRKRRDAAVAGKNHTAAIETRHTGVIPPPVAALGSGTGENPNNVNGPPQARPDRQGEDQATQASGRDTAVHQPMAPATATSIMVSPNISPMPSPSISPIPNVRSLNSQPSQPHLSTVPSQFTVDTDRASYVPMPPYPGTPPIDRRFSPSPVNTIRSFSNPSQVRIPPPQASGNTVNGDIAYTSIYGGYSSEAPPTPASHISHGRPPVQTGEVPPVPKMTASWFQDRDSVVSEMDTAGAIPGPPSKQGTRDNRMTMASELMGSVPGQSRRAI